jgi:hypothetical protein
MASGRSESCPVQAGHRHLSVLACAIKGKCIWMILEFEGLTYVDPVWPAGLPLAPRPWGAVDAAHAVTPPTGGSRSLSSSSDGRHEFYELVHEEDEARQCFSDATREVSRLERCLDAIWVALEASKRETLSRRRRPPMPRPASWARMLLRLVVPFVVFCP